MRLAESLARTPAYRLVRPLIARLPAPRQDIGQIAVEVEACSVEGKRRRAVLSAPGAYHFTAAAAAQAAVWAAAPGFAGVGPLTPAEAFAPIAFLDALAQFGVAYRFSAEATSRRSSSDSSSETTARASEIAPTRALRSSNARRRRSSALGSSRTSSNRLR
jgi:hypothetical protein